MMMDCCTAASCVAVFCLQNQNCADIISAALKSTPSHYVGTRLCVRIQINSIDTITARSRMMTAITGKIITLDADSGEEIGVNTISLEGGVMPFAVVPDNNGGYYVYLSRIMTSDAGMVGNNKSYGSSIYIYHTDDLNKLNLE